MTHADEPSIEWLENDIPYSVQFGDTFYAKSNGRAETRYVFIDGNQLLKRWCGTDQFTIAELGFGTGLNFIETWRVWNQVNHNRNQLRFVSFESNPLRKKAILRAISRWPELRSEMNRLVDNMIVTQRHIHMQTDDVSLSVLVGDANDTVPAWAGHADAWYLDGFSPDRNPGLWNGQLLKEVFHHTVEGGTFATYTSAGWVRRNLIDAGFSVAKSKGFGSKREMMVGVRPFGGSETIKTGSVADASSRARNL